MRRRSCATGAQPWDIVQPGVAIKQYPCCGSTHPAVDAMLSLVREHALTPAMVERVDSWTHPRRLAHTNRPDPQSELDAKFSVQYCLARALLDRRVSLEHFEGDSFREPNDPRVAAAHPCGAASRDADGEHRAFRCRGASDADRWACADREGGAAAWGAGRRIHCRVELLEAKFLNCAARALPMEAAEGLLAVLRGVDTVVDMRRVTDAMVPAAALAAD